MSEVIKQIFDYLIANYTLFTVITMGVIASFTIFVLSLIKKPIKLLTSKISNLKLRKFANKVFIFMAFGIATGVWFILNFVAPNYFTIEGMKVLLTGAFSVVIYSLGDGIITKSTAQKLIEEIKEIDENTSTNSEKTKKTDPVSEFWKKVK